MTNIDYGNQPLTTIAIPIECESPTWEEVHRETVHMQWEGLLTHEEAQRIRNDFRYGLVPPVDYQM